MGDNVNGPSAAILDVNVKILAVIKMSADSDADV